MGGEEKERRGPVLQAVCTQWGGWWVESIQSLNMRLHHSRRHGKNASPLKVQNHRLRCGLSDFVIVDLNYQLGF